MGLFKKKQKNSRTELKCLVEGCSFTSYSPVLLKKHTEWKHPELATVAKK